MATAAATALLATTLATPSRAGQVNLAARTTTISETIVTSFSGTPALFQTITATGTIRTYQQPSALVTVTRLVTISESFNSTSATVSFELAQDEVNYTSPFDNLFAGSIGQGLSIQSTSGLSNVQISAGAGNVSVASNSVLDGTSLGSIFSSTAGSGTAGATNALTLALVPGFALQNSNINALVLAATNAIANSNFQAVGGAVTAIDVEQTNLNEYSPHGNIAAVGQVSQTIDIAGTAGVTTIQAQAGAGNVQASHNAILVGSISESILLPPGT